MNKADFTYIFILLITLLALFFPVFYSEYLYTDESVQIWFYKQPGSLEMFIPQGRYLTEKLMQGLFTTVTTIKDLAFLRVFALAGWALCLPVWYYILKQLLAKENLPLVLAFFAVLYLVTMPPMAVSIGWATCCELFIANTAGLLSGYVLLKAIITDEKGNIQLSTTIIFLSVLLGLISLFSYQSGFGCFIIPFLLHFLNTKTRTRTLVIGIGLYFFTYLVYYLLFKYNLKINNLSANERTGLHLDPWGKLKFFFTKPLAAAFHFTYLFNEKSKMGVLLFRVFLGIFLLYTFLRLKAFSIGSRLQYVLGLAVLLLLMYIPPLLVKENYASNRTLLALNMGVFLIVAETLLNLLKTENQKKILVYSISLLFILNAGSVISKIKI